MWGPGRDEVAAGHEQRGMGAGAPERDPKLPPGFPDQSPAVPARREGEGCRVFTGCDKMRDK